jgi:hypothetical protein
MNAKPPRPGAHPHPLSCAGLGGHGRRPREPRPPSSPRPAWPCWRRHAAAARHPPVPAAHRMGKRQRVPRQRSPTPAACARTACRTAPTLAAAERSPRGPRRNSGSSTPSSRRPRVPATTCPRTPAGRSSSKTSSACRSATVHRPWCSGCCALLSSARRGRGSCRHGLRPAVCSLASGTAAACSDSGQRRPLSRESPARLASLARAEAGLSRARPRIRQREPATSRHRPGNAGRATATHLPARARAGRHRSRADKPTRDSRTGLDEI